jgi:hypothetical protein
LVGGEAANKIDGRAPPVHLQNSPWSWPTRPPPTTFFSAFFSLRIAPCFDGRFSAYELLRRASVVRLFFCGIVS